MSAKQIVILTILGYIALPIVILILAVLIYFFREAISDAVHSHKSRKRARKKAEKEKFTAKGNSDLPPDLRAFGRTVPQQTKSASPDDEKPEE